MNDLILSLPGKRKAEDDAAAPPKKAKLEVAAEPAADVEEESKTIFVGSLSWSVDNDRLAEEFSECGEVLDARVQLDRTTGKSRGFGYVTFATGEAVKAAIALNGTKEIDGRVLNLDISTDNKGGNKEKRASAFGDTRSAPTNVLFVGNLSWDTTEDAVWEIFKEHGNVDSVRMPTDRESGRPKGYGYVEYSSVDSAKTAIDALSGQEIDGRAIRLDFSQPRDASGGGGRGGDRGGRGGGRGFDRGGGGRGGGFGGGRGGGGGFGGGRGGFGDRVSSLTTTHLPHLTYSSLRAVVVTVVDEAVVAIVVDVAVVPHEEEVHALAQSPRQKAKRPLSSVLSLLCKLLVVSRTQLCI